MDIKQRKEMFGEGGYCEGFRYLKKTDVKKPKENASRLKKNLNWMRDFEPKTPEKDK